MKFDNKTYDIIKYITLVFVPALTTLVGVIGTQLQFDMTTIIVIMTALNTFLGSIIGVSNIKYNGGKNEEK